MAVAGSPGIRWIRKNTTVTTTAITGITARSRRARYVNSLHGGPRTGPPHPPGARRTPGNPGRSSVSPWRLLLHPDAPEAGALRLVVESLDGFARGTEPEEIAIAGHRNLVVEDPGQLLPQGVALLGVGFPRELPHVRLDLLVARPPGPAARQVDGLGGIEDVADRGGSAGVLV